MHFLRRPAASPAYYLGRPASTWLEALGGWSRRRRVTRPSTDTTRRRAA
jgi:hypothetical protein